MLCACSRSSAPPATPTAPDPATPSPDIRIAAGQPLTIAVSAALSGEQQSVGADTAAAAELAVADYGAALQGHPLRVLRKDDECSDPEKAASVAQAIIDESGVVGVIGPICTTGAQAADPLYEEASVVHITPTVTRVELSAQVERYFFRTAWRDDMQSRIQATYSRDTLNASTAAIIDDGEPYGKSLADAFVPDFEAMGGRIVSHERAEPASVDLVSLAVRVASANPDIVVFEGLNPEAALLLKELRTASYRGVFIAPDAELNVHDFVSIAGDAAEGAIVTAGPVPDEPFTARFRERTQHVPSTGFVLQTYDAVTLLLRAVDAVASPQTDGTVVIDREALADAVRSRAYSGLTGTIRFDTNGDRSGDSPLELGLKLYRVVAGQFQSLP
jgi:branched-chain amino acid transport system substrate-binding protein